VFLRGGYPCPSVHLFSDVTIKREFDK